MKNYFWLLKPYLKFGKFYIVAMILFAAIVLPADSIIQVYFPQITETRKGIAKHLPDDWPFWCNPDYSEVEKEIKSDPRWKQWVAKTQA